MKKFFLNLSLTGKMIVTYVVAVFIPTVSLASGLYYVNMNSMRQIHYHNQRYEVAISGAYINLQISQVMAAANLLQESGSLLDILGGVHPNISNTMFYYLRDVSPLLNVALVNPNIQNIRIYGFEDMLLNMDFGLTSLRFLEMGAGFADTIRGVAGTWMVTWEENRPVLRYYRALYASTFPFRRGLLEIQTNFNVLTSPFGNTAANVLYFTTSHGGVICYQDGIFSYYNNLNQDSGQLRFDIPLQYNFPSAWTVMAIVDDNGQQDSLVLFALIIIFIIFTALYFIFTKSITNRLQAFSNNIQKADIETLKPYTVQPTSDEIGIVINSYNNLVDRANSLIHENLLANLEKRNAEYYALQSQIKPHFLYNILENIRMSAEINNDFDTAAMLTTLGKHLRYNLDMSSQPVPLEEELNSAKNYLQIQKIRMKEKIHYEIEISTEIDSIHVPKFILQPLLENAILHGCRLEQKLCIHVAVVDGRDFNKPGCAVVIIQDNGSGIKPERLKQVQEKLKRKETENANHIGLLNVNFRLSAFYNYAEEGIVLESCEGKGTTVTIFLDKGKIL